MAIRFQCPSCQQPIETDDEWGGKLVNCPYCRNTVTAPLQSTLEVCSAPPPIAAEGGTVVSTASAAPDSGGFSPASPWPVPPAWPAPPYLQMPPHAAPSRRGWAIAALVLALCSLGLTLSAWVMFAPHRQELMDLHNPMRPYMENVRAMMDYMTQTYGGMPEWYVLSVLCWLAGGTAWVAALVCGIIGVRSPAARKLATASLVLCGVIPAFCCCAPGLL